MKTPETKGRGGPRPGAGRPPVPVTLRKAIDRLGVDPQMIDPLAILAALAVDPETPPTAKVAACRVLIEARRAPAEAPMPPGGHEIQWLVKAPANA